jgi:hypothetical protein
MTIEHGFRVKLKDKMRYRSASALVVLLSVSCTSLVSGAALAVKDESRNSSTAVGVQDMLLKPLASNRQMIKYPLPLEYDHLSKRAWSIPVSLKGLNPFGRKKQSTEPNPPTTRPLQLDLPPAKFNPIPWNEDRKALDDHLRMGQFQLEAAATAKPETPIKTNDLYAQAQDVVRRRNAVLTSLQQAEARFVDTQAQIAREYEGRLHPSFQPKADLHTAIADDDPYSLLKGVYRDRWHEVQQKYIGGLTETKNTQMEKLAKEQRDLIQRAKALGRSEDLGWFPAIDMSSAATAGGKLPKLRL